MFSFTGPTHFLRIITNQNLILFDQVKTHFTVTRVKNHVGGLYYRIARVFIKNN